MADIEIQRDDDGQTLRILWDNRRIRKDSALSCVLPAFWVVWTGCAVAGLWIAVRDGRWHWPSVLFLTMMVVVAVVLPLTWLLRYSTECVELGPDGYRHYYRAYPWFQPIRWPLASLTRIELGYHVNAIDEPDAVPTLRVYAGTKRDLIAYWADEATKERIFGVMNDHLAAMGSPVERRNTLDDAQAGDDGFERSRGTG